MTQWNFPPSLIPCTTWSFFLVWVQNLYIHCNKYATQRKCEAQDSCYKFLNLLCKGIDLEWTCNKYLYTGLSNCCYGQRDYVFELSVCWMQNARNTLREFVQIWYWPSLWLKDELITFWGLKLWSQGHGDLTNPYLPYQHFILRMPGLSSRCVDTGQFSLSAQVIICEWNLGNSPESSLIFRSAAAEKPNGLKWGDVIVIHCCTSSVQW